MDVAVLFSRLGPYHVARLNAVGKRASLTAIELSGKATEYAWDPVDTPPTFQRITVFPERTHLDVTVSELREKVEAALTEAAPDAVALPGWDDSGTLLALHWCREHGVPAVVMSASTALDAPRTWWKEAVKKQVVQQYDAALVGGLRHKAYIQSLGLPSDRVFTGYNVVDNEHFRRGAAAARANENACRTRINLPDTYFLSIGRFVEKKNFPMLLTAYAAYRDETASPWDLVLLGDGPLRTRLERLREELHLEDCVHFPGFKQYDALPSYYGLAGAFVHTSLREQWGLVVNEAMAAGLPVVVSDRCGCVPNLVQDGENGYSFDPEDPEALVRHLSDLSASSTPRETMGDRSQQIIEDWTPDVFAEQLMKAMRAAASHSATRPSHSFFEKAVLSLLTRR